jgi:uncharacterized protein (DUF362 family)
MGKIMQKLTRRDFLKLTTSAAVVLSTPPILSSCGKEESVLQPTPSSEINARVAAVRGNNLYTMTNDVLDALGGIEKIINAGEKVFIKPNMVTLPWAPNNNCFTEGECTKPEIIIAVSEACLKAGAAEVVIGDGSQMYTFNWSNAVTLDRSKNLIQEALRLSSKYQGNVKVACLETDSPGWVDVPSRTSLGKIRISSLVANADRVISLPVAKTHSWAQLTLALKNFVGVTSLEAYAQWVSNSHWDRGKGLDHSSPRSIAQIYLDVVDAVRPDITIIDFSIGVEGDGPTVGGGNGFTVDMKKRMGSWLLIGSTDIMAADATAARIMNHNVTEIHQLNMGYSMGLGEIHEQSIEIVGDKLADLIVPWRPAVLKNQAAHGQTNLPIYHMAHEIG